MAKTLRSQNKCNDCRYTWYPRGKDLSRMCPNCGSANVAIVVNWMPLIAVGGVVLYLVFGGKSADRQLIDDGSTVAAPSQAAAVEVDAAPLLVAVNEKRPSPETVVKESVLEPSTAGAVPVQSAVHVVEPELARHPTVASAPVVTVISAAAKADEFERIYSDEEISVLEEQKRYHGDDPIVRARLGIPSRETKKLIR